MPELDSLHAAKALGELRIDGKRDRRRIEACTAGDRAAAGRRALHSDTTVFNVFAPVTGGRGELEVRLGLRGSRRDQVEPFATVDPIDVKVAIKREDS